MKNLYPALWLLFSGFGLQAQSDWQLFRPGVQYLYEYPDASWVESSVLGIKIGMDTCTDMYSSLRWLGEFECNEITSSFMGYEICQTPTYTSLRIREDEYVTILQTAALDEKWPAYTGGGDTVWAQVSYIEIENFLGLTDSVKSIYFYTKEPGSSPVYIPTNYRPIRVSKQYGLISTIWFRDFPHYNSWTATSTSLMPLVGLSAPKVGLQNPNRATIFNLQSGDEIHIKQQELGQYYPQGVYQGAFTLTDYLQATITNIDSVVGTEKIRFSYSGPQLRTWRIGPPASVFEVTLTEDTSSVWEFNLAELEYLDFQPGALMVSPYFQGNKIAMVSLKNSGFCNKPEKYLNVPLIGSGCFQTIADIGNDRSYIEGLAGHYYYAQSIGGVHIRSVAYFRRDTNECGTPFDFDQITSANEAAETLNILLGPNPTPGPLQLQLPQGLVADLKLYDLQGRLLWSENRAQGSVTWNLGALPAGAYQISASVDGDLIWRQRVLKL